MSVRTAPAPSPDVFKQWLELSRLVLTRYYPEARYATLVIPLGDGVPDCVLPVTPPPPPPPTSTTPTLPPS